MGKLEDISKYLQQGRVKNVQELVKSALDEGVAAASILDGALLKGMGEVGERFKTGEAYIPEVLIAARAMNAAMETLKSALVSDNVEPKGRAVLGTIKGDMHDIGKNIVKIMFEGRGIEVIDLGTDVSPGLFVDTALERGAGIVGVSALLTTTMPLMRDVVEYAKSIGARDKISIMIGGAPVTQEFCREIGADCYTGDAASAADAALKILGY